MTLLGQAALAMWWDMAPAMRAEFEESPKPLTSIPDRIRAGDPEAVETERARFAGQRGFQFSGAKVDRRFQKSRST